MADEAGSVGTIFAKMVLDNSGFLTGLKESEKAGNEAATMIEKGLSKVGSTLRNIAYMTASALGVASLISYAKEAMFLSARVDTLAIVIKNVGINAGYTASQMMSYVEATKKQGITTQAAMDSVVKMAQAQMDLAETSKLARIAQDAAVIGNTNSSDAFQRMIYGIKTGQPEILRTIGINVSFEQSYSRLATQLKKNAQGLTESEKVQARMNGVLQEGVKIEGVYEAALTTAGKAIHSLKRYTEELQLKLGEVFQPALKKVVDTLTESFKGAGEAVQNFIDSGKMASIASTLAEGITILINVLAKLSTILIYTANVIATFKDALLALAVGFAVYKVTAFITSLLSLSGVMAEVAAGTSLTSVVLTRLGTATAGLQAMMLAINPVALGIAVVIGTLYWAYQRLTNATAEAEAAYDSWKAKVAKFDADQLRTEIKFITENLQNQINSLPKKGFLERWFLGDEEDLRKNAEAQIMHLNDLLSVLSTEQNQANIKKQLSENQKVLDQAAADKQSREDQQNAANLASLKARNSEALASMKRTYEAEAFAAEQKGKNAEEALRKEYDFSVEIAKKERSNAYAEAALEASTRKAKEQGKFNESAFWLAKTAEIEAKYRGQKADAELQLTKSLVDLDKQRAQSLLSYYKDMNVLDLNYVAANIQVWERQAVEYKRILGSEFKESEWMAKKLLELHADVAKKRTEYLIDYYDSIDAPIGQYLDTMTKLYAEEANLLEENLKSMFGEREAHEMAVRNMAKKTQDYKIKLLEDELSKTEEVLRKVEEVYGRGSDEYYKASRGVPQQREDIEISKLNAKYFGGVLASEAEKAINEARGFADQKIKLAKETAQKQVDAEKQVTESLRAEYIQRLKDYVTYAKGMGNAEGAKRAQAAIEELVNSSAKSAEDIAKNMESVGKSTEEASSKVTDSIKEASTAMSNVPKDFAFGKKIAQEFIDGTREISSKGLADVGVDISMKLGDALKEIGLAESSAVKFAMDRMGLDATKTIGENADKLASESQTILGRMKLAIGKTIAGIAMGGVGGEVGVGDKDVDKMSDEYATAYQKRINDEVRLFNDAVDAKKAKFQELLDVMKGDRERNAQEENLAAMMTGIAGVTEMYNQQAESLKKIEEIRAAADKASDPKEKATLLAAAGKVESKIIENQISGYRQLAGTLSKTFKEGSKAREAFHKIEMGLAAVEMAIQVKNLAMTLYNIGVKLAAKTTAAATEVGLATTVGTAEVVATEASTAANVASVATDVAATTAKTGAKAVEAVATQATAGPYIGFALAAAMIALMVAIGAWKGGSSSGSSKMPEVYTPAEGTVLGAKEGTTSESLSKSLEIMEETYDMENVALNRIYQELRSLNSGIKGLVSSIFRSGGMELGNVSFPTGTQYPAWWDMGWSEEHLDGILQNIGNFFEDIGGYILNGLFGGKTEVSLQQGGIEFGNVLVKSVMDGMSVSAWQFALYKIEEDGGWFHSDKTSWETRYAELDSSVVNMLTKMFDSIGTTLVTLSEELGTDVQAVYDYVFETTKINLKDMDAEEMSKTLTNYFSDISDKAAKDLFGSIISQYQEVGEALFETAVRLVKDKNIVQEILELTNTGLTFEAETIRKSRMVVSEAWTEWNTAKENLEKAKRQWFVDAAKALFSGEEIPEFPTLGPEPIKMVEEFYDEVITGTQKLIAFSEALIEKAGSLDNLVEYFNTYYEAFIDEAEKQADLEDKLTRVLKEANVVFPKTRAEYKALVEQFGKGVSDADQEAYVTLLRMSGYADEYFSYLEEALEEAADAQKEYVDSLKEMIVAIDDWLANLNLSELAPGGVSAQAMGAEYARRYEAATKTGATAEDIDAFLNIATDTLNFMKNYTGSDTINYKTIYDSVVQDVTMLQDALKAITGTEDPVADATIESAETLVTISSTLNSILNEMLHSSDTAIALPAHAKGALTTGPAIAGEKGQEWIIPTYEPEKTLFLKEHGKEVLKTITSDKENTIIKNLISSYTFAKGGLTDSDSTGEKELNWMMPTYDIERSRSFKSIGVDSEMIGDRISSYVNQDSKFLDPEIIGKSIARTLINESSDGDNEGSKEMHVHLYIDRKEITESVVAGIRSGDENLLKNLKKVMN